MREEAVSPVIAFMLLLMIVVSFISLLNAYYVPSLKQQAEIEHHEEVHRSFLQIGSDINRLITFQQDGILQEQITLGGGDVLFSPIRSSGTLQIKDEGWIARMVVTNISNYATVLNCTPVSLSYRPIGNFWLNQGYVWRSGLLEITKGNKSTWAEYTDDTIAEQARSSFITLLASSESEETPSTSNPEYLGATRIKFKSMSSEPDASFMSSNGIAGLDLILASSQEKIVNVTSISWTLNTTDPSYGQVSTKYEEWFADRFNYDNCIKTVDSVSGIFTVTISASPIEVTLIPVTMSARLV